MKAIDSYKMFDPMKPNRGLPPEMPGNYIFLLRPGVKLPVDMIQEQPTFTTLEFEGTEHEVLYTGVTSRTLYERVFKTHLFGNNAGKSTLRKSLGCLWGYPLIYRDKNPNPNRIPKTKYRDEDEQAITQWMKKNLLVLVVPNISYRMKIKELRNRGVEE